MEPEARSVGEPDSQRDLAAKVRKELRPRPPGKDFFQPRNLGISTMTWGIPCAT